MKLCAHLGFQFTEFQGLDRLRQAALAGFEAVEWPAIYDFNIQELVALSKELGLRWAQVTLPTGDAARAEKGLTALPGRQDEFRQGLELAIERAKLLGAPRIHPMAGIGVSLDDPQTLEVYLKNMAHAIDRAKANGLEVLVEVISEGTVPGYAMSSFSLAERVQRQLPDLLLLLDTFHAQVLTGDPCALAHAWAGRIGHVQIADYPGRHEPGTGELDFKAFFDALTRAGYGDWIGCEYKPKGRTLDGLHHLQALRALLQPTQ